jgi:hypothetical protein
MEITDQHTGRAMPADRTSFLSRRRLTGAIDCPQAAMGRPRGFFSSPSSVVLVLAIIAPLTGEPADEGEI